MKSIVLSCLAVLLLTTACNKKEDIQLKPGVSLPTVQSLTLTKGAGNEFTLNWQMPSGIPAEIAQPLAVQIEIKELIELKTVVVGGATLADAPTTFTGTVPDAAKTYQVTVKLNGWLSERDPNYSSNIFSLGQTVTY